MTDPESIEFAFEYPALPDRVWDALTNGTKMATWLTDNDFVPVVGHRFMLGSNGFPGLPGPVVGEVIEVDPPRRLVMRWRSGSSRATVIWLVQPASGGSRLRVIQSGLLGHPMRAAELGAVVPGDLRRAAAAVPAQRDADQAEHPGRAADPRPRDGAAARAGPARRRPAAVVADGRPGRRCRPAAAVRPRVPGRRPVGPEAAPPPTPPSSLAPSPVRDAAPDPPRRPAVWLLPDAPPPPRRPDPPGGSAGSAPGAPTGSGRGVSGPAGTRGPGPSRRSCSATRPTRSPYRLARSPGRPRRRCTRRGHPIASDSQPRRRWSSPWSASRSRRTSAAALAGACSAGRWGYWSC